MWNIFRVNPIFSVIIIEGNRPYAAAAAGNGYYDTIITLMSAAALLLTVGLYFFLCHNCQKRIQELLENKKCHCGWNLWRLRKFVFRLELQKAEQLVEDMKQSLSKNFIYTGKHS